MNKQLEEPLTSNSPLGSIHTEDTENHIDMPSSGLSMKKSSNFLKRFSKSDISQDTNESDNDNKNNKINKGKNEDENYRLAGRSPLKTLVYLAIGPLISQLVSACYGVVASMWVAKAMGDLGMAAVSLFTNIDNVGRAFGFFMNCSASQKISSLFGEGKGDEAGQVICDLMRCCVICGFIVPGLLLPPAKPIGKWFGADEITNNMAFQYLSVLLGGSMISCFFLLFCGCLQAEGRTTLVSIAQISSFVLNMALFCPLFLLVFKLGTVGAGLATVCSEAIPMLVLCFLYFRGKFGVKPKLNMLLKKFSTHTWPALSVGVSQLAANVSRSLPSILQRKFMGLITENPNNIEGMSFNDAMAGFNAVIRIYGITDSVRLAISMALLPTASFANSAGMYSRFLRLILHGCWMNLVWGASSCVVTVFGAKYVAMIISNSENFLKAATPMLRTSNMEAPYAWGRFICQTILQSLSYGALATGYSVGATFFVNIGAYCLMYYTNKTYVSRMMWSYSVSSSVAFVAGVCCLILPLKKVYMKAKASRDVEIENLGNGEFVDNLDEIHNEKPEKKDDCDDLSQEIEKGEEQFHDEI